MLLKYTEIALARGHEPSLVSASTCSRFKARTYTRAGLFCPTMTGNRNLLSSICATRWRGCASASGTDRTFRGHWRQESPAKVRFARIFLDDARRGNTEMPLPIADILQTSNFSILEDASTYLQKCYDARVGGRGGYSSRRNAYIIFRQSST